jgi:hypothetical protein
MAGDRYIGPGDDGGARTSDGTYRPLPVPSPGEPA